MNNGNLVKLGTKAASLALNMHLPVKGIIKQTIYQQFCGGEDLQETVRVLKKLEHYNVSAILDYGVEGKESEAEFQRTADQLIHTLEFAGTQSNVPYISCKVTGITRFDLLAKISAGESLTAAENAEKKKLYDRMFSIAEAARKGGLKF